MEEYGNFMDQEKPPVPLLKCVAEYDDSALYEVDEGAIFETMDRKYVGVVISGCS